MKKREATRTAQAHVVREAPAASAPAASVPPASAVRHPLESLMQAPLRTGTAAAQGVGPAPLVQPVPGALAIGEVLGFADGVPLVVYPGQPGPAALRARTTVDLHGAHVGHQVALMFESADPLRPVVIGLIRGDASSPEASSIGSVEVDADGERLLVTAKDQLVLRCGASSITLTKAGKVLIQGKYISSRSSGVNRIKGGSVQIN